MLYFGPINALLCTKRNQQGYKNKTAYKVTAIPLFQHAPSRGNKTAGRVNGLPHFQYAPSRGNETAGRVGELSHSQRTIRKKGPAD